MKKLIMIAISCIFCLGVYAQSSNLVSSIINTNEITYGQVCYLVSCEQGLIAENASETEAIIALESTYPQIREKIPAQTPKLVLTAQQFSFICTEVWNIKTSLMYMIGPCPRYAFREMKGAGYFNAGYSPDYSVPGRNALLIIADCSENAKGGR